MKTKETDTLKVLIGSLSKKENQPVLKCVYADNSNLVATNGRCLTVIQNRDNLPKGLYDKKLTPVTDIPGRYPNYNQVIPEYYDGRIEIKLSGKVINRVWNHVVLEDNQVYNQGDTEDSRALIGEYYVIGSKTSDAIYLKFKAKDFCNITGGRANFAMFFNNKAPCKIEYNQTDFSIIMPLRK
jgi:hypothetical protein